MELTTSPIRLVEVYAELEQSRSFVPMNKRPLFDNRIVDEQIKSAKKLDPEATEVKVTYNVVSGEDYKTGPRGRLIIHLTEKTVFVKV